MRLLLASTLHEAVLRLVLNNHTATYEDIGKHLGLIDIEIQKNSDVVRGYEGPLAIERAVDGLGRSSHLSESTTAWNLSAVNEAKLSTPPCSFNFFRAASGLVVF